MSEDRSTVSSDFSAADVKHRMAEGGGKGRRRHAPYERAGGKAKAVMEEYHKPFGELLCVCRRPPRAAQRNFG
jgi:hypothetical protein